MSSASEETYYIPNGTHWPIIGSIGLTTTVVGFANYLHGSELTVMFVGLAVWKQLGTRRLRVGLAVWRRPLTLALCWFSRLETTLGRICEASLCEQASR